MSRDRVEHTLAVAHLDEDVWLFLLTKQPPRLVGKQCQQTRWIGPEEDRRWLRCMRPVWGDGRVDGDFYGYCSRCWHEYAAFHSAYTTFQANPASLLNTGNVNRLRFLGNELPDLGADLDDTFPEEWAP